MIEAAKSMPATDSCDRCGQVYRRPQWGRDYACPACGETLGDRGRKATSAGIPRWVAGVALVGVFAVCVLALSVARARSSPQRSFAQQPAPSTFLTPPASPVTLPADLETRLREKIRYMESDLRLEPKNEALLSRLAGAYAALALTLREERRAEAGKALNLARVMARRRKQAYRIAPDDFQWLHDDLDSLEWAPAGSGMMLPQMMGASGGALLSPTPVMGLSGNGPVMRPMATGVPPLGGVGHPGMAPPSAGSPGSALGNGPGQVGMAPGPMFPYGSFPPVSADQESSLRAAIAACLDIRRQKPNDLNNLDALGEAYQRLAEVEQDPQKRKSKENLKLALEVFRDAARRSRLRIHKASFLRAAGNMYSDLGDYPNQYRMAKLAAEQTPFSPAVWDELQDAALRVGRFRDSRDAARKAKAWTLPIVQPPTPMQTGQLAIPSAP